MIAAWYTRERNGGVARSSAFGRRSSRTSATLNNQPVTQLTYDQIGNRITCNNTHYRPNACNQYEDLSYDSDGNMTMYDGWALTWNGENRLIRMIKGTAKLEFAYDYMGRRYEKKVYANDVLTKHQRFIYDGYKLIEIRNALNNDALTHSFVWRKVPQDVPYSMKYGNTTYYYITDANKNVVCLLSSYSIDAYYQYGPWGEIREIEGTAAYWNPFRFSSEFYDDETGLVYYNYRYYSPTLGRWLSRDPIEEEGGMNLYAMCENDAIKRWDENGLFKGLFDYLLDYLSDKYFNSCCNGKLYNIFEKYCCNGKLFDINEKYTITIYYASKKIVPLIFIPDHAWIEWPSGSAGFYGNGNNFAGTGYGKIISPEVSNRINGDKFIYDKIDARADKYDLDIIEQKIGETLKEHQSQKILYFFIISNCLNWASIFLRDVLEKSKCKKE